MIFAILGLNLKTAITTSSSVAGFSNSMARSTRDEDYEESTRANMAALRRLVEELQMHESQSVKHMQVQSPDLSFEEASDDGRGAIPVMLTDLDLLDCPICVQPLCFPIYQCEHGHIVCSCCCDKSNKKCPSCCSPIGSIRCRVLENLIESLKVECKNKRFGCEQMLIYQKRSEHENTCLHSPCFCPISSCSFASSSNNLYNHFTTHHSSSATKFTFNNSFSVLVWRTQTHEIFQEQNEGVIFILNHEVQQHGRVFNVDCIGPSSFTNAFVYRLSYKDLETSLSLETVPEVFAKWEEHSPNNCYLTIPSRFSKYFLQVCIKKAHPLVL